MCGVDGENVDGWKVACPYREGVLVFWSASDNLAGTTRASIQFTRLQQLQELHRGPITCHRNYALEHDNWRPKRLLRYRLPNDTHVVADVEAILLCAVC